MNGVLGTWNLYAGVPQAIYVNNYDKVAMIAVSVLNRHNIDSRISIALSTSATTPTNAEYLEYEAIVGPKGVLERTGIAVSPGQYIVVESELAENNAVCWGVQPGTISVSPIIITTNNGVSPTWLTAATLPDLTSSGSTSIILTAS